MLVVIAGGRSTRRSPVLWGSSSWSGSGVIGSKRGGGDLAREGELAPERLRVSGVDAFPESAILRVRRWFAVEHLDLIYGSIPLQISPRFPESNPGQAYRFRQALVEHPGRAVTGASENRRTSHCSK